MSWHVIIVLLLIGLAAGILGGLIGVGGGIIIVPSLIYFLGFSQKEASGTSLGILLLPVGILGVLQFYKAGYIDMRTVWLVSFGFLVGSYFGSKIALRFSQETVRKIFAVVMILIALKMIFFDREMKDKKEDATSVNSFLDKGPA